MILLQVMKSLQHFILVALLELYWVELKNEPKESLASIGLGVLHVQLSFGMNDRVRAVFTNCSRRVTSAVIT